MFNTKLLPIVEAVREAAKMTLRVQDAVETHKSDRSPVTVADYAVQVVITEALKRLEPGKPLIAEEDSQILKSHEKARAQVLHHSSSVLESLNEETMMELINYSSREVSSEFWTLDPVDGTKGFLRGANYATALGFISENKVRSGILACPKLDMLGCSGVILVANQGEGCWYQDLSAEKDWVRLRVSPQTDPTQTRILHSYEAAHTNLPEIETLRQSMNISVESVGLDSQAKYALLAAGLGELIVRLPNATSPDYREKIWDHAAGLSCLEEAGGQITDMFGETLDFSYGSALEKNQGIIASNSALHPPALKALNRSC